MQDIETETRSQRDSFNNFNFYAHYTSPEDTVGQTKGKEQQSNKLSNVKKDRDCCDSGNFLKLKDSKTDQLALVTPSTIGLIRIMASHFDVSLLLLPLAFLYLDTTCAILTMSLFAFFSVISSRLLIETVRLQPNNFDFQHSFEFEHLISPGFEHQVPAKLINDIYILLQQVQLILAITASTILFDQILVSNYSEKIALKP